MGGQSCRPIKDHMMCMCLMTASGILLLGLEQTDISDAKALSHENDIIDIYSNSWGPPDDGFYVEGPLRLAKMTLEQGAREVSWFIKSYIYAVMQVKRDSIYKDTQYTQYVQCRLKAILSIGDMKS